MRERPAGRSAGCYWTSGDARTRRRRRPMRPPRCPQRWPTAPCPASRIWCPRRRRSCPGSSADGVDRLALRRALRGRQRGKPSPTRDDEVVIGVHYDGPDLHDVALHLGWTTRAVVAIHTSTRWRVGSWASNSPGFRVPGARRPGDRCPPCELPRRSESRPRVPVGSVAVAAGYSAVYPGVSPGGWNLLGHTDFPCGTPPRTRRHRCAGAIVRFTDLASQC